LTDFMKAARLVLRTSSVDVDQPPADKSTDNSSSPVLPKPIQANLSSTKLSSGTPLMIIRDGHPRASRHAKRASLLELGDAIRLKSGERVVITYVGQGFTHRYIEWRGGAHNNCANVPLDTPVRLAWSFPRGLHRIGAFILTFILLLLFIVIAGILFETPTQTIKLGAGSSVATPAYVTRYDNFPVLERSQL